MNIIRRLSASPPGRDSMAALVQELRLVIAAIGALLFAASLRRFRRTIAQMA